MGGPPSRPRRSSLAGPAAPRHCIQTDRHLPRPRPGPGGTTVSSLCITLKGVVMNKQPREPAKGWLESPNLDSTGPGWWGLGHDKHAVREPLGATSHARVALARRDRRRGHLTLALFPQE